MLYGSLSLQMIAPVANRSETVPSGIIKQQQAHVFVKIFFERPCRALPELSSDWLLL